MHSDEVLVHTGRLESAIPILSIPLVKVPMKTKVDDITKYKFHVS
jgi:hypothetical protein